MRGFEFGMETYSLRLRLVEFEKRWRTAGTKNLGLARSWFPISLI